MWPFARAKQHEVYPDGKAQEFCCEPTCQAYTCDIARGLTLDMAPWLAVPLIPLCGHSSHCRLCELRIFVAEAKAKFTGVSDETCCTATCSSLKCPAGFKILGFVERTAMVCLVLYP